ncbi:hypothetical protein L2E82_29412 [Cichorium intybus]|uniref:Uncharacterized protein n=1 Tax=Cichorium intybus TaxID=13427 RepID=A0ACB9CXY2_CICIN|nr:hypothetical protein L2E82_29412 [Cichorium intybus]
MKQELVRVFEESISHQYGIGFKVFTLFFIIRDITKQVAAAVITEAIEEDLVEGYREMDARELRKLNKNLPWFLRLICV